MLKNRLDKNKYNDTTWNIFWVKIKVKNKTKIQAKQIKEKFVDY